MTQNRGIVAAFLLAACQSVLAGSFINTNGSSEGVAINGFDTVAFHTEKKAVKGKPEFTFEWQGAKWRFTSEQNLQLFKGDPEKYAPQYGGNCAMGMADGYISKKPANGLFEIVDGKLYLFPDGNRDPYGTYNDWRRLAKRNIADGDRNWSKLKAQLEAR
ncbi:MAG: YHS domain-containing protein [Burkholderiaceae bacterium]|nr:YHS domain-containing protein [Burkholderiaceae bacterium]